MSANSNFSYAIHILTYLSSPGTVVSSAEIADSIKTNPVTVRRLIGVLREAGLVTTVPGSAGGAQLARPAAAITLGDVYSATKDEQLFGGHHNRPNIECPIGRNIEQVLLRHFGEVDEIVKRALMRVTIQDIMAEVMAGETT